VPVVREFPDVFLDELPGLPPAREIEFEIEVMPGTRPIFIPLIEHILVHIIMILLMLIYIFST